MRNYIVNSNNGIPHVEFMFKNIGNLSEKLSKLCGQATSSSANLILFNFITKSVQNFSLTPDDICASCSHPGTASTSWKLKTVYESTGRNLCPLSPFSMRFTDFPPNLKH